MRRTQALDFGRAACGIQYLRGIRGARFPVSSRDQPTRLAGGAVAGDGRGAPGENGSDTGVVW